MIATQFKSGLIALSLSACAFSAQALTLPFQGTKSDSVLQLSEDVVAAADLVGITFTAKGNATAVGTSGTEFSFPITSVTSGSPLIVNKTLNVESGTAIGSALVIERTDKGVSYGITFANFKIDYKLKQVIADITPRNGTTTSQAPLFTFNIAQPLVLKLNGFNLTGTEKLDQLLLTPQAKDLVKTSLNLPSFAIPALDLDYGTLSQFISLAARKPAASTKPYVPPTN